MFKKIVSMFFILVYLTSYNMMYAANVGTEQKIPDDSKYQNFEPFNYDGPDRVYVEGWGYIKKSELMTKEESMRVQKQAEEEIRTFIENNPQGYSSQTHELTGVTNYNQISDSRKDVVYGGAGVTIGKYGCLLASMTNVLNHLKNWTDDPKAFAQKYTYYNGGNRSFNNKFGEFLGISYFNDHNTGLNLGGYVDSDTSSVNGTKEKIHDHLGKYAPVIVGFKKGNQTHFVFAFKSTLDNNGNISILIKDPMYKNDNTLDSYTDNNWSISGIKILWNT